MSYNNCSQSFKNTAENSCKDKMIQVAKIIFCPDSNAYLSSVNTADDLMDRIHAAQKSQRFYVFPLVTGMTDNSEDWKTGTTGYGVTQVLGDGNKSFTFEVPQDVETFKRLRSFNNNEGRIYFIDSNGIMQCEEASDGNLYGYKGSLFVKQGSFQDGQNISNGSIMVNLSDAGAFEDRTTFVDLGISSSEIFGLTDIRLTGTFSGVKLMNDFANEEVTATYGTLLAVAGAWKVDGSTFSGTVTYTAGTGFTFSATPTTSVELADCATLHNLTTPVDGIEGINKVTA